MSRPVFTLTGRITREKLNDIDLRQECDLFFQEAVLENDFLVKDANFHSVHFTNCNARGGIAFINCTFRNRVALSFRKTSGPISFVNCKIHDDVHLHKINASPAIEFLSCRVSGSVTIDSVSSSLLTLDDVEVNSLSLLYTDSAGGFNKVHIDSLRSATELRLSDFSQTQSLDIVHSRAPGLHITRTKLQSGSQWSINHCHFESCSITGVSLAGASRLEFTKCTTDTLQLSAEINCDSVVTLEGSMVRGMASLDARSDHPGLLDVSGLTVSDLRLARWMENDAMHNRERSPLFMTDDENKRLDTVKLMKDMFYRKHAYGMEDRCFYEIKKLEARLKLSERKSVGGFVNYFGSSALRYLFGWGVNLANPILSSVAIILFFGVMYYGMAAYSGSALTFTVMGERFTNLVAGVLLSAMSFFNMGPEGAISVYVAPFLYLGEFILGLILTTLIIGIIIRKLVR